jgi:hypothetical protein
MTAHLVPAGDTLLLVHFGQDVDGASVALLDGLDGDHLAVYRVFDRFFAHKLGLQSDFRLRTDVRGARMR